MIHFFSKLPGLGPRSARRLVLHLIKHRDDLLAPMQQKINEALSSIMVCEKCGNLDATPVCAICRDPAREAQLLCIVEDVDDLWAMERSKIFKGRYHVLGGRLSALEGVGPDQLRISSLLQRVESEKDVEIILALSATVDGQTTAHYLTDRLRPFDVQISRLAQGMPIGGELDYLDDGTLAAAFLSRQAV